jgi:hypothetical protein
MNRLEKMNDRFAEDDKVMAEKIADISKNSALTAQALAVMQTTHVSCIALREKEAIAKAAAEKDKAEEDKKNTDFREKHELYGSLKMKFVNIAGSLVLMVIGALLGKYLG